MEKGVLIFGVLFLFLVGNISAANHYVREGATGNNDGSDWNNAWTEIPAKLCQAGVYFFNCSDLARGDTYYIADGIYSGRIFNIDERYIGDEYIFIKKATVTDHGTDAGWLDSFGDGQANFTFITIQSNNIIFDGQIGSGSNPDSYGFRVPKPDCASRTSDYQALIMQSLHDPYGVSNVEVRHVAAEACGNGYTNPDGTDTCQVCIKGSRGYYENITISNNYMSGGSSNMHIRNWHNSIIENNYFTNQWSSSDCHGQQISPGGNCDDIIFRNNIFTKSTVFVIGQHTNNNERWQVYNNIIIGDDSSFSAVFANADSGTSDVFLDSEFHHNTFVNVNCGGRGAVFVGTLTDINNQKSYSYNNLFYNSINCDMDNGDGTSDAIVFDYNAYYDSTGNTPGTNGIDTTGDPFVDSANGDYKLKQGVLAINAGKSDLGSPFNIDIEGTDRNDYAPWDIGAYEYISGTPSICSSADTNKNNIVEITELINYISLWKLGDVVIGDLITAIGEWKNGC